MPEIKDDGTREIAASGAPAPTKEEAQHELKILQNLLDEHGCPTTRDLIAAAAIVVDMSHKDAHSPNMESVSNAVTEKAKPILGPALQQMAKLEFSTVEEQAKWYLRMTSILLQQARLFAAKAHQIAQDEVRRRAMNPKQSDGLKVNEPVDPKQPILQMKIPNEYVN